MEYRLFTYKLALPIVESRKGISREEVYTRLVALTALSEYNFEEILSM